MILTHRPCLRRAAHGDAMPPPQTITIDGNATPAAVWLRVAEQTRAWAGTANLALRDLTVLVPFVQLIEPARQAFASIGGWQPRVETTHSLTAALAPASAASPGQLSGAPVLDALVVAQLLRRQPLLADWQRQDPRAFEQIVQVTLDTAYLLQRASAARAPAQRAAWWDLADGLVREVPGPGTLETALGQVALAWARMAPAPPTDVLFDWRPAGWVVVGAAGTDVLSVALATQASCPALLIDTDGPPSAAYASAAVRAPPRRVVADGLEAEASAAAAEVIEALNAGQGPVALIALDRVLTRRIRALLERQRVAVIDETGWRLSTTRAAARVMALLRAAKPGASPDERLEWLKGGESGLVQALALQRLEALWRAGRQPDAHAMTPWTSASAHLAPLQAPGRRSLAQWLSGLNDALESTGLGAALRADAAGVQLLAALSPPAALQADAAWASALGSTDTDLSGFADWVDRSLDQASFVPPALAGVELVLTPLARAVLRPFGSVVIAGADERHLAAPPATVGCLPEATAVALGLDTPRRRLQDEHAALAQLLRVPRVCFVHRRLDGNEPVAASPALDAIDLVRQRMGSAPMSESPPRTQERSVALQTLSRPAPPAPDALPTRLSASSVESLRTCPYQFFARSVLGLRESEELDEAIDKRDYGNWLHAVLHRFHRDRGETAHDETKLNQAADAVAAEMAIDAARLLPYRAGFEQLVPAYLAWLHLRDARGIRWAGGERWTERSPPELEGVVLHGRIDRIDTASADTELIDYKTSSLQRLKDRVREPFEDTQLAFYALLMEADLMDGDRFSACYLALDTSEAPQEVAHPSVARSAQALLEGMVVDLRRLRAGAGFTALGEGESCEHCEARGLCRRDQWSDNNIEADA